MKHMKLQDLLAPTWHERARAEDALMAELPEYSDEINIWPQEVQDEICSLKPSPEAFLSALVAFWADVSENQYKKRMEGFQREADPYSPAGWSSAYLAAFPMMPATPPVSANFMRGMWVWSFISRLGPYAEAIESQLIACLEHPEPTVWDAAESALGTANSMTDEGFAKFLAIADRRGREGQIWTRAQVAAKHMNADRVLMVLADLEPGISEKQSVSRFAIIEQLDKEAAQIASEYLLQHMTSSWSNDQLANLIQALTQVSEKSGFKPQAISAVESLAKHKHHLVRCATALFLATHSPETHYDILKLLVNDSHPWVLLDLCRGLKKHSKVPPELLRAVVSKSLGNYDGYDGEPHDTAVSLLVKMGESAQIALPEILAWWNAASLGEYIEYEEVRDALDLADTLGAFALPLKTGLEHALITLTKEDEQEEEWPSISQPEVIPEIQARLKKGMEDSGVKTEEAANIAQLYGNMLTELSDNLENIQTEIDTHQAEFDAEQRELYPERYSVEDDEIPDDDEEDEDEYEEEENDLIVRLRNSITLLNQLVTH